MTREDDLHEAVKTVGKRSRTTVDLNSYDESQHKPGTNIVQRVLWYWINAIVFSSWYFPCYALKRYLLRLFGGEVGRGVVIKPRVNIKYPWKLVIGDYSWIGEGVWIDNIEWVKVADNCCISQGVYICTGNHNWSDPSFGLVAKPILIGGQSWVGAFSIVSPGVMVAEGTVITAGSVVKKNTAPWTIYSGNPAIVVRNREVFEKVRTLGADV